MLSVIKLLIAGRTKPLTNGERGRITARKESGLSNGEMSRGRKRTSMVIDSFLNLAENFNFRKLQVDLKF